MKWVNDEPAAAIGQFARKSYECAAYVYVYVCIYLHEHYGFTVYLDDYAFEFCLRPCVHMKAHSLLRRGERERDCASTGRWGAAARFGVR